MTSNDQKHPAGRRHGGGLSSTLNLLKDNLGSAQSTLLWAVFCAIASTFLELVPIGVVAWLVTQLFDGKAQAVHFWYAAGGLTISIPLCYLLFGLSLAKAHIVAYKIIYSLRQKLAAHLLHLPLGRVSKLGSGFARKLMIDEPEKLEIVVGHAIPEGIGAIAMWVSVSVWLFMTDWVMGLFTIAFTPLSFLAMAIAMKKSSSHMKTFQDASVAMNGAVTEFLRGIITVKNYQKTGRIKQRTEREIQNFADQQVNWGQDFIPWGGTFHALILANISLIVPAGVWLIYLGRIGTEEFILFVILGGNYGAPLMRLFNQYSQLAQISLAVHTVQDVLDRPSQPDTNERVHFESYDICFDNVCFSYGDKCVVQDFSIDIPQGEMAALVGPSGAGKSTIAMLLARFDDPQNGRVCIGGHDISKISSDQLMEIVSFVFQDTFLFKGSVLENLTIACPDASLETIKAAAHAAQAHDFISALPNGYDTMIGDGVGLLSGGERQRLAIARAILKDAPILVLDEATAFADPGNELEIQRAISALTRGKTVLVIAHRLHTIVQADQIIVLNNGRCEELGNHQALISRSGLYARMWRDYHYGQEKIS